MKKKKANSILHRNHSEKPNSEKQHDNIFVFLLSTLKFLAYKNKKNFRDFRGKKTQPF